MVMGVYGTSRTSFSGNRLTALMLYLVPGVHGAWWLTVVRGNQPPYTIQLCTRYNILVSIDTAEPSLFAIAFCVAHFRDVFIDVFRLLENAC